MISTRRRLGGKSGGRWHVARLVAAVAVAAAALFGQCARVDGQVQPLMQPHDQPPPPGVPQHQQPPQHQQQQPPLHQPPQYQQQQQQEQQSPQQPTAPWYETLPAVAMDYKVIIDPGKEDCYFQFVNPGATFYASAQVLRGGDGMAGFAVRHPNGQVVHPYQWKASSDYQDQESTGGYYSVCIDNQFSKFAAKLVNLYITVIRYDKWDEYHKEIEDMNVSVENFTSTVKSVESNINYMLQHQYHVRSQENRDYNLLVDNKTHVNRWSIMQILLIMGTSTLQVYFVRKLFESKTGKSKTRA